MKEPQNFPLAILHGYRLEGSGSCVYVRNLVHQFARTGRDVVLICQDLQPQRYDFIAEAHVFSARDTLESIFVRKTGYPGRVICYRPHLTGGILPIYVDVQAKPDSRIKSFRRMANAEIADYIENNLAALESVLCRHPARMIYANHIVMMPYIASVACRKNPELRYFLIPHGSEIEYLIRRDRRFWRYAKRALDGATGIISGSREIKQRIVNLFPTSTKYANKTHLIPIGVDHDYFSAPLKLSPLRRFSALQAAVRRQAKQPATASEAVDPHFLPALGKLDPAKHNFIVNFGRLIPEKGVQDVLAAAPLLLHGKPRLRLVIAGTGQYKAFFQLMIAQLQAGDRRGLLEEFGRIELETGAGRHSLFRFIRAYLDTPAGRNYFALSSSFAWSEQILFAGYLKHEALRYLLSSCEVAIFPSIVKEAYPLTVYEAMACGAFPIASNLAGLAECMQALRGTVSRPMLKLSRISMRGRERVPQLSTHTLKVLTQQTARLRSRISAQVGKQYGYDEVCNRLLHLFSQAVRR